jgi:mannose-6-phosphate isomerase-like protein (cupin superfamily)
MVREIGHKTYLLMDTGQFGSKNLGITWVDGVTAPGQTPHQHAVEEQVYVIIRGRGIMKVGDEEREVYPGTLIFVPPQTMHALRSIGEEPLAYVCATAPPFVRK